MYDLRAPGYIIYEYTRFVLMQKGRPFLVHKAHSYPNVSYEYTICM